MQQICVPAVVRRRAVSQAAETILRTKHRGVWKAITWSELDATVARIGSALLTAGFGRGDVAAVISETRPEAAYADLAILGCGAASLAIHPEDEADRLGHILASSGTRLAFVENEEQLDKVLSIRDRCPALGRIVVFEMKGLRDYVDAMVVSLAAFAETPRPDWPHSVQAIAADQPAVIQFSRSEASGFGRILTHGDLSHMIGAAAGRLAIRPGDERLAVLRMADITERAWGLYLGLQTGCISNYPERPDTMLENLQELQPTVLGANSGVWASLHALASLRAKNATRSQRIAYEWALGIGGAKGMLAGLIVLPAVRREFGLNRLRVAYVGGAAVQQAAGEWAASLGITIQRLDEPAPGPDQLDERYQSLMHNAYA
nr:AMP-binding protein [uncultured Rhodopila sp.]